MPGIQFNKPVVAGKIYRDTYNSAQGYLEPIRLLAPYVWTADAADFQLDSAAITGKGRGNLAVVHTGTPGTNIWVGRHYDSTLKKTTIGLKASVNAATVLDAGLASHINEWEFSTGATAVGRSKWWNLTGTPFDYYMKVKLDTIPAGAANQDKGSAFFGLYCPQMSTLAAVLSATTTQAVDGSFNTLGFRVAGVTSGVPVWAVHYRFANTAGTFTTVTSSLSARTPAAAVLTTSSAWTLLRIQSPDGRRVNFSINDQPVGALDSRDGSSAYDLSHAVDDQVPANLPVWSPLAILSKSNTNYSTTWQAQVDYMKMAIANC